MSQLFKKENNNKAITCRTEADLFQPRFGESRVISSLKLAKEMFPSRKPVLLTNLVLEHGYKCDVIQCDDTNPEILQSYSPREYIFIYACDIDEIGMPFIRELIRVNAKYIPVHSYLPSLYHNIRKKVSETLISEYGIQRKEGYIKWGVDSFFGRDQLNVMQAIDMTAELEGDFVEIGCFRGSTSRVSLRYMSALGIRRCCFFLDVFDGFNYTAAKSSSDIIWYGTHETEGRKAVEERLKDVVFNDKNIKVNVLRNNIIEDEFPDSIQSICLAYIDVDMYEAVYEALVKVGPKIVKRGVIVVEDPGHTPALIGARVALDDYLLDNANQFISIYLESGQTFLVRI